MHNPQVQQLTQEQGQVRAMKIMPITKTGTGTTMVTTMVMTGLIIILMTMGIRIPTITTETTVVTVMQIPTGVIQMGMFTETMGVVIPTQEKRR